jgi:hypothetical protein
MIKNKGLLLQAAPDSDKYVWLSFEDYRKINPSAAY